MVSQNNIADVEMNGGNIHLKYTPQQEDVVDLEEFTVIDSPLIRKSWEKNELNLFKNYNFCRIYNK